MNRAVEAGKTLLVKGPASIHLVSGEVEIFKAPLRVEEPVIVRDEKWVPLHVRRDASFEITQSGNSAIEERDEHTVPDSWLKSTQAILALEKPAMVMIVGPPSSGKTSLSTLLTNTALKAHWTVAVIDSDLGQSDIGPPTTVGLAYVTEPTIDLYWAAADAACFVGQTNPRGAEHSIANAISLLTRQALSRSTDLLIVNTDGWIGGAAALEYKTMLVEKTTPDIIISMGGKEIIPLLDRLGKRFVFSADVPRAIPQRSSEQRKNLRDLNYMRHFRLARTRALSLDSTKVEAVNSFSSIIPPDEQPKEWVATLESTASFCIETSESLWVIVGRGCLVNSERLYEFQSALGKRVRVINEGDEKGLIAGLHDEENRFLGLGLIISFNVSRRNVKILTNVNKRVATVRLGKVRLDSHYREVDLYQTEES